MVQIVYIAGPYSKGDVAINIHIAMGHANAVIESGYIPYIPHLTHFWHLVSPRPVKFWYDYDNHFLRRCDCVLRIPGESVGADNEVALAKVLGIPVYYSVLDILDEKPDKTRM